MATMTKTFRRQLDARIKKIGDQKAKLKAQYDELQAEQNQIQGLIDNSTPEAPSEPQAAAQPTAE